MTNVVIMGAAGRDFHNFNTKFKDNPNYNVVAFTATQIPNIENRTYPPELAGKLYPDGIPILPETTILEIIQNHNINLVVFSYSDVKHSYVMHKASEILAAGANFMLMGETPIKSTKPIISVCAVRTGCGKSQTTRYLCQILKEMGKKVVAIRHPMPYGDLSKQIVQRFSCYKDFETHNCTIEEREEYEPLVSQGTIVYAGVDYKKILEAAELESDVIVWDGGNNDTCFYQSNLNIVIFDPHRSGHELLYYPGETNMLKADIAIINKIDSATKKDVELVRENIEENTKANIIFAVSDIKTSHEITGKKAIIIEDGPTLTHGEMDFGAGVIAGKRGGAKIKSVIPAMGYTPEQIEKLESTINSSPADIVISATPINLSKLISVNKPIINVTYNYKDGGQLDKEISLFLNKI